MAKVGNIIYMIDLKELVKFLEDNKLKNISVYNMPSTDEQKYIIIATSSSAANSKSVADNIATRYNYQGKIEGYFKGEWIVFDFDNIALHIFLSKTREKYNLDKLYKPLKFY